ncbi:helix-turn-helix domain-containing protein [Vibrio sp. SCSIO 43136]|uniref:helix-turn-helix domain-containing protein n=1 Tax=Vibrio sp. SCSIO 43136 TaxID=2819101 RepID=UPI002075EEE3|nr:helix-turn-helix domain-containing protein [Vibrio sp. SCSIO 43136]USD68109.1 helix-turn-helix domain-containing protein [Vibrio sp. SCSIO 43136]
MSVKIMGYVWDIPTFKGSDKLIMLCLADFCNDKGFCWPSIETIARKSGVSVSTVKAVLKKLVEAKWLTKKNQFKQVRGKTVRASNQYQLHVGKLRVESFKYAEPEEDLDSEQPDLERSDLEQAEYPHFNGQNLAEGRAESAYKPSIDPPIDPSRSIPPKSPKGDKVPYEQIQELYNEILGQRLTHCKELSSYRKRQVRKFWTELGEQTLDAVRKYFEKFNREAGEFYFGENDRGWKADFSYLMRLEVLVRTREGNLGGKVVRLAPAQSKPQEKLCPSERFRAQLREQGRPVNF